MSANNALRQFRIMAIAEGFSWLGLLVTMALKYGYAMPEPNKWVGYIHGFLFLIYCFYITYFLFEEKWPFVKCLILIITAFLPFGTFWAERKYLRQKSVTSIGRLNYLTMKLIKRIFLGLLILISVLLVVALFIPTEIMVSRSITINQDQNTVFNYVKHLKNQPKYGVWWKADPKMKITTSGTDGEIGYIHAWDSKDENVGAGQQKITDIDSSALRSKLSIELKFIRPFESVNPSYIQTKAVSDEQTNVTWAITSKMPYPLNLMGAVLNMEKMLGTDLEKGLNNLKVLLEKEDY